MSRALLVTGGFDNLGLRQVRFLHECSRLGPVTVFLWTDAAVREASGTAPGFPLVERRYLLESLRVVSRVVATDTWREPWRGAGDLPRGPVVGLEPGCTPAELAAAHRMASALGGPVLALSERDLAGFPAHGSLPSDPAKRRVVVTGCYDWLHSGHVRFFEEASSHGELYVVVGHDANVRLLKGEGHPRFPEQQRSYMVGAVRHVHRSLVSSGTGWMDAEPEIRAIQAQVYAVNDDGDKPEKLEYCRSRGLEYLVLQRVPAAGLPRRSSTDLRGF